MLTLQSRFYNFIYKRVAQNYDFNSDRNMNKAKIEFIKGVMTSSEEKDSQKAKFKARKKRRNLWILLQILGQFLMKFGVSYHIIILILLNSGAYAESDRFDYNDYTLDSAMLIFYFIIYVILNFKLHNDNNSNSRKKGNSKVQIIKFSSDQIKYQMSKWKKLKKGDIILLKREQACPADILIIDSKDNNFHIDSFLLNGINTYTPKFPLKATSFFNDSYLKKDLENYKKILSGKITIENIKEKDPEKLQGYIKLKKDPKSEKFGIRNVILKESVLKYTDWVIGFVIFANQDCFISKNSPKKTFQIEIDDLEKILNFINLALFFQIIIFAIIHSIFQQFSMSNTYNNFANTIIPENINFNTSISNYIMYYSPAILFYLNMIVDLSLFIKKFLLERKFQNSVIIKKPKTLGSMRYVDKIFLTKSSLLTGEFQLDSILLQGDIIGLDISQRIIFKHFFKEHAFSPRLLSISINSKSNNHSFSYLDIPDEPHFYNTTYRTDGRLITSQTDIRKHHMHINLEMRNLNAEKEEQRNLNKYDMEYVMKTLLLCHCTKTEYNPKTGTYIHDTFPKINHEILSFCNELNLQFCGNVKLSDAPMNCYKLNLCDNFFYFFILSMNEITLPRNRFSIIISENQNIEENDEFSLFVCGYDVDSFLPCLNLSNIENESLKDQLNSLKENGMQSLIYATKKIKKEEFNDFINAKMNLNLDNDNDQLNDLYSSLEQNLEMILVMNFKETLKNNVYENIAALKDAQTKYFLLSKDSESSTMATAFYSKIIDRNTILKKFISQNNKSAIVLMKHFLNNLRKDHESSKRDSSNPLLPSESGNFKLRSSSVNKLPKAFTLVLDGTTMEIILKNAFLKENLKFILIWTQNIIFYQISAKLKHQIIKFFKQTSLNGFTKTLAIGSCYEDMKMFHEADISIEIGNNNVQGESDFILRDFEYLAHFIVVKGPFAFRKIEKILILYIFIHEILLFSRFFYEFFSSLSLNVLFSDKMFHFIGIGLMIISTAYFIFSPAPQYIEMLETFPLIYKSNALKINYSVMKFIFKSLIPSIVVAIGFLLDAIVYSNDLDEGNARSFPDVQSQLFICIVFVTYLQKFALFSKLDKASTLNLFIISMSFVAVIFGFSFFMTSDDFSESYYITTLTRTFYKPESIALFLCHGILASLIIFLTKFIYKSFNLKISLYKEALHFFIKGNLILKVAAILERKYKNHIKPMIIEAQINAFKKTMDKSKIDQSTQEMLNPIDINKRNMNFNPLTLCLKNPNFKKKFYDFNKKYSLGRIKIIFLFFFLTIIAMVEDSFHKQGAYMQDDDFIMAVCYCLFFLITFILLLFKYKTYSQMTNFFAYLGILFNIVSVIILIEPLSEKLVAIERNYYKIFSIAIICKLLHHDYVIFALSEILILIPYMIYSIFGLKDIFSELLFFDSLILSYVIISISLSFTYLLFFDCFYKYDMELMKRDIYLAKENLKIETKKINDILTILVPSFIKGLMYKGKFLISEDQGDVAVLFCDICDFEKIIVEESHRLIQLLDSIFRAFDNLCLNNNIQKIETVGKTYMACAGLKEYEYSYQIEQKNLRNSTSRIINLAIDMVKAVKNFRWGNNNNPIELKIGIHYGPVIAGVIGFHKPQFSLIGDTVNTTSRVCAAAEINKPTLSMPAFKQIDEKQFINFYFNQKSIFAKGKGDLLVFQMERNLCSGEVPTGSTSIKRITILNKLKSNSPSKISNSEFEMRMRSPNPIEPIQNHKIFQLTNVLNGVFVETRKSKHQNVRNNFNTMGLEMFIESENNINQEEEEDEYMKITLKDMLLSKSKFQSPKNSNLKLADERKSGTFEIISKLQKIGDEEKSKIIQADEILSQEFKANNEIEEITDLFMDEPLGYLMFEESRNMAKSRLMVSSSAISVEAQAGIKEFNELNIKNNLLSVNEVFLTFNQCKEELKNGFMKDLNLKYLLEDRVNLISYVIWKSLLTFMSFIVKDEYNSIYVFFYVRLALLCSLMLAYLCYVKFKSSLCKIIIVIIYLLFFIEILLNVQINSSKILVIPKLELIIAYLSLTHFVFLSFIQVILITLIYLLHELLYIWSSIYENDYQSMIYIVGLALLNLGLLNYRMKLQINLFNEIRNNNFEKGQLNKLIMYLLPPHILEKFKYKAIHELETADRFQGVTILFADIVSFTNYSVNADKREVFQLLRILFTEFDKLCLENDVFKLYTIGDCYVVMSLVDVDNRNLVQEAKNVVSMGLSMLKIINEIKEMDPSYANFDMRIGIHTGNIIGGIVGTEVVRYDIYGNDVYIANKMESNGKPGCINISQETKEMLEKKFSEYFAFEFNKDVFLPNVKKNISSFYLTRKKPLNNINNNNNSIKTPLKPLL